MGAKMKSKYMGKEWIGEKYNFLTVIGEAFMDNTGNYSWKMRCDCGKEVSVRIANVVNGHTTSCGCNRQAIISAPRKHGQSKSRLYRIWDQMNVRCRKGNRSSKHYADRGITICEEWKTFTNFERWAKEHGYTDELSIERLDVNGNYCPENCTWIPRNLQTRNLRRTHWVDYEGKRMSLVEASERAGLPYKTVFARIMVLGWPFEKAISVPSQRTTSSNNRRLSSCTNK